MRKRSLSTGDLARYCQVTPATIVNWIRAKKLDVYTTPGGQYRMELEKFSAFLEENGFPIPDELKEDRVRRILVIDDDDDIVEMLSDAIQTISPNYEVEGASNGYDALIRIGDFKPDLIVLDLMMPKMDGVELCRRLRANNDTKNIHVIAVTALDSDAEDVRKIKRIGIDGIFEKPVHIDEFCTLVAQLSSKK